MRPHIQSIIAGSAATLLATAAVAADLPSRRAPPVFTAPPPPAFTWTGAYVGANAGYSFDDTARYQLTGQLAGPAGDTGVGNSRPADLTNRSRGFTGGGQIGYNFQFTPGSGVVLGIEADAAYVGASNTQYFQGISPAGLPADNFFRSKIDLLGTVRGRIGYAFDRLLVYGTGGFAYGDVVNQASLYTAGLPTELRYFGRRSGLQTGYAFGGGIEYALPTASFLNLFNSSAVTIKVEYLRYDLGTSGFLANNLVLTGIGSAYLNSVRNQGNLVRAGLNYKFDFAQPVPVVARY